MKIIGLTGGIGTGKSTVSRYVKEKGYEIIDADQIARDVVQPGTETLRQLVERFGGEILLEDGSLDRRKLAAMAFASPEGKAALDEITHGAIFEVIRQQRAALEERYADVPEALAFLDAPLLLETGLDRQTDGVWVVDAPEELRMERVMQRDHLMEAEIRGRMKNQIRREEALRRAQEVLDNSGTVEELYAQIDRLLARAGGGAR